MTTMNSSKYTPMKQYMKVIAVLNMKGGVGKTTSSLNIAAGLANKGYKVLLIDIDPQANSTDILLDIKHEELTLNPEVLSAINSMDIEALDKALASLSSHVSREIYIDEMLVDAEKTEAYESTIENLDIIPSRLELANVERDIRTSNAALHLRLIKVIKKLKKDYDYIIIDCPPIINALTINVLNAADEVIAPIKIDRGAEKGLMMTIRELIEIAESYNLDILIRPLFTMVQLNNTDKHRIEVLKQFENEIVKPIQVTVRHQEKPISTSSYVNKIIINDPRANVGKDYQSVVDYLEEIWN